MPSMANITIKKADGTTDLVFNALTPSSGDLSPAVWRANNGLTVNVFKPRFEMKTRGDSQRLKRRADFLIVYPVTATVDGKLVQVGVNTFTGTASLDQSVDETGLNEMASAIGQLLGSTLVKSSISSGYAPN